MHGKAAEDRCRVGGASAIWPQLGGGGRLPSRTLPAARARLTPAREDRDEPRVPYRPTDPRPRVSLARPVARTSSTFAWRSTMAATASRLTLTSPSSARAPRRSRSTWPRAASSRSRAAATSTSGRPRAAPSAPSTRSSGRSPSDPTSPVTPTTPQTARTPTRSPRPNAAGSSQRAAPIGAASLHDLPAQRVPARAAADAGAAIRHERPQLRRSFSLARLGLVARAARRPSRWSRSTGPRQRQRPCRARARRPSQFAGRFASRGNDRGRRLRGRGPCAPVELSVVNCGPVNSVEHVLRFCPDSSLSGERQLSADSRRRAGVRHRPPSRACCRSPPARCRTA